MRKIILLVLAFTGSTVFAFGVQDSSYVSFKPGHGFFPVVTKTQSATIVLSKEDHAGVHRALTSFQNDVAMVTGKKLNLKESPDGNKNIILAGTLGKHALIDKLVDDKKINVESIRGRWETFLIEVIMNPFPGVDKALVIAGSDKRGTIFGIYDVSKNIGVSPWYWWADVAVARQENVLIKPGKYSMGEPKVKYRGIFINDEQPALGGWVAKNYGGFKSGFYEKVFELILRMKGNFLWPAMWGQSFYTDDPLNPKLADEYGIVISTSHHEPLMRAHVEWKREGGGAWNYQTNAEELRAFWQKGIERMGTYESVVTLAMRGDGDEPMSEDSNIKLLQQIVRDQREIIANTTGKPIEATPQVWALYKEVQDYYDRGMRVPDDVTLLLCDDNWGNIRKLPDPLDTLHPGGYGIYYHFDYVGGPRNYKWLNTNPIPKIWEQMHLAYKHNASRIWIVNVGDIKPMEFPIEFFLDYAWNPERLDESSLNEYTRQWCSANFGQQFGKDIAEILRLYTKYNGRRKPELLAPDSFSPNLFSLAHYREAETVVNDYNALAKRAYEINEKLPENLRDAYYQLILYPVAACANLNEMYYAQRLNHWYAKQGRAETNPLAEKVKRLFERDAELTKYYNETMAKGKWNHMMDQHHIGYRGWHDDFNKNILPPTEKIKTASSAEAGVYIEGEGSDLKPGERGKIKIDRLGQADWYVEIFNKASNPFSYELTSPKGLRISQTKGQVHTQTRVYIAGDWKKIKSDQVIPVKIKSSAGSVFEIDVEIVNSAIKSPERKIFYESDGSISIAADHFSRMVPSKSTIWKVLPDHGRTGSAIKVFPVTVSTKPGEGASLEYDVFFLKPGTYKVDLYLSPTIDFTGGEGLQTAISVNDEKILLLNVHQNSSMRAWEQSVKDNIRIISTELKITKAGKNTIKIWAAEPGVVYQKIVIDTGGLKPSYLGPPEQKLTITSAP